MEKLQISINPTYKCNLKCQFCYLSGIKNKKLLDLKSLKDNLDNLSKSYQIINIDIYGGQIFLLDDNYLKQLFEICKQYIKKIYVITNMTIFKQWIFQDNDIIINISWDYKFRKKYRKVLSNIKLYYEKYKKPVNILMTDPRLYLYRQKIVKILNNLDFPLVIAPKIYYKTDKTNLNMDFQNFQIFILYLQSHLNKNIHINLSINFEQSKHIFINPNNKIVNIMYNNNEQFFSLNFKNEKNEIKCLTCRFYNMCMKQHQYMKTQFDCCGQYKLLKKFKQLQMIRLTWETRRKMFYDKTILDDVHLNYSENYNNIPSQVIRFFKSGSQLVYPAKSYYVAIIYAYLLHEYFGQDFMQMLNRKDLLNYDDAFFKTYSQSKQIYDCILSFVIPTIKDNYVINDTKKYFYQQFLIDPSC